MRFARLFARLLVLVSLSLQGADPLDTWQLQTAAPELRGMAEGPPGLVVAGYEGKILFSEDGGITWESQNSGTTLPIFAVVWADSEFVATGRGGLILTSPDGKRWTQRPTGVTNSLPAVTYANGTVVVAGFGGTIFTSTNRVDWQRQNSGTTASFAFITQGNGTYVAVGETGAIYYSTNLTVWRPATSGTTRQFYAVRHINGLFIAVGERNTLLTSKDGVKWTPGSVADNFHVWDVAFLDGKYWAIGQNPACMWVSSDLINWTQFSTAPTTLLKMLVSQGRILVVGPSGSIRSATRPGNWTTLYSGLSGTLWNLEFVNGEYTAGGNPISAITNPSNFDEARSLTVRFRSPDGIQWQLDSNPSPKFTRTAFGNNIYVRVGPGLLESSTNGADWIVRDTSGSLFLRDIIYGNEQFMAVGEELFEEIVVAVVVTSPDGIVWSRQETGIEARLDRVQYGNGVYVAGNANRYITSKDGINWTAREMPFSSVTPAQGFVDLDFGNGRFVALRNTYVINTAVLSTSRDGVTWSDVAPPGLSLSTVTFGSGYFVGVGPKGTIVSSVNGGEWRQHTSGITNSLRGVAFLNGRFVAGGEQGTILLGQPLPARVPELLNPPRDTVIGAGVPMSLRADVNTSEPATFQWWKDNRPVPGATRTALDFLSASPEDEGSYQLVVSNAAGTLTTAPVNLRVSRSLPADFWQVRNQPPARRDIARLAFIAGVFVAATDQGVLLRSTDGSAWSPPELSPGSLVRNVATVGNYCVALGEQGQGFVSTNGINWTPFSTLTTETLRGVCRALGFWVIVGDHGTILTSPDLAKWTARESGTSENLRAVAYGADQFMVAGDRGTLLYSFNGSSWEPESPVTLADLNAIAFGNDLFLAGGKGGVLVSSGGTGSWIKQQDYGPGMEYRDIVFHPGIGAFVATGLGISQGLAIKPSGGIISGGPITSRPSYQGLAVGANAVYTSIGGRLFETRDSGGRWVILGDGDSPNMRAVAGGPNLVIAAGDGGSVMVVNGSQPGLQSRILGATNALLGAAWGAGRAVVVGDGGSIITTTDAIKWERLDSGTTNQLRRVCFGGGRFLAAGANGSLTISTNGLDWALQKSPTTNMIASVKYAEGRFWLNDFSTRQYVSEDAVNWTTNAIQRPVGTFGGFDKGNGVSVFLDGLASWFSPDDSNWTKTDNYTPSALFSSLAFGGETFVAAGDYGALRLSLNGIDWYKRAIETPWRILGVGIANDRFYAVGEYGTILESAPFGRMAMKPGTPPELVVQGTPGQTYRVEFKNDLQPGGPWQTLTNVAPATNAMRWRDPGDANRPARFFRIQLAP